MLLVCFVIRPVLWVCGLAWKYMRLPLRYYILLTCTYHLKHLTNLLYFFQVSRLLLAIPFGRENHQKSAWMGLMIYRHTCYRRLLNGIWTWIISNHHQQQNYATKVTGLLIVWHGMNIDAWTLQYIPKLRNRSWNDAGTGIYCGALCPLGQTFCHRFEIGDILKLELRDLWPIYESLMKC